MAVSIVTAPIISNEIM